MDIQNHFISFCQQPNQFCSFHDSAEKPMEIDHHLYEFGSVEYHIQVIIIIPNPLQTET